MASKSLGSLTIDLLLKTGAFATDVSKAEGKLSSLSKSANRFGFAIGTAISGAVGAVAGLTAVAINFADELNDMSHKTGVSAEVLSGWGYAAKQSGTDIESLSAALPKLAKNIAAAADEGSRQSELFKALGINVKDAKGNLRSVEELLPQIADRFKALDNETTETALAMELFGKSGAALREFLDNGSDGIDALVKRARELGVVVGQDTVNAADEFNDKLADLKALALGFGLDIAAKLLPALNDTVDKLIDIAKEGSLAANAVEVISAAFSAGVGTINLYNKAVASLSIEIERVINSVKGIGQVVGALSLPGLLSGANPLERLKVAKGGIDKMLAADEEARKQWEKLNQNAGKSGSFSDVTASATYISKAEQDRLKQFKDQQDRLNAFLANPTGGGGKSSKVGKSDAERDAERLLAQYERLKESLKEQGDLYGHTTEAARLRYALENTDLANLTQAQKDELIILAERLDMLDREKELQEKLDRETESFNQMNDAILDQVAYLGKSADEQEIIANLARAGVSDESERGKVIIANTQALQAQREAMYDQIEAMDAVRDAGADFLYDWTSGSKSFKDSFLDALDSIHRRLLQMIAENLMDQLFGKQGDPGGGSAGGWLGNLFGSLFGSGQSASATQGYVDDFAAIYGGPRAKGGDVFGNRAYLVGEQGPEMFVPRTAGVVMTADDTSRMLRGGSRGVQQTNNFIVHGSADKRTVDQIRSELYRDGMRASRRNY